MFKQGDVVKVKGLQGKHLVSYDYNGDDVPFVIVVNQYGTTMRVHFSRVSKAKVKKVTGVYQLVRQIYNEREDNTEEIQVWNGSDTSPVIGGLAFVKERAAWIRAKYPNYTYVIFELTITPNGTTVTRTDY